LFVENFKLEKINIFLTLKLASWVKRSLIIVRRFSCLIVLQNRFFLFLKIRLTRSHIFIFFMEIKLTVSHNLPSENRFTAVHLHLMISNKH